MSALEICRKAREVWLSATTEGDLQKAEQLYRSALNSKKDKASKKNSPHSNKRQRTSYAELSVSDYRKAAERLSLLYCQSGRTAQAKKGLEYLEFQCRLARQVLDYPLPPPSHLKAKSQNNNRKNSKTVQAPCIILDNFLHAKELKQLKRTFEDIDANYWTGHDYKVEPPSPYFSYVIELQNPATKKNLGFIAKLALAIRQSPDMQERFPDLKKAKFVEMWAHNRPHPSGHQMHFDSDDEGRGGKIRNPVCTSILYISTNSKEGKGVVGGPSLVTNQKLEDTQLATHGWLAHPKSKRLVAFDGTLLHGVIPGKGVQAGRRVTLMLAFWKSIKIRDEPTQGSARPFPTTSSDRPSDLEWVSSLTTQDVEVQNRRPDAMKEQVPMSIPAVYETLDGEPWKPKYGMPDYEQVFQGF